MIGLSVHTGAPRGAGPRATDEEVGRALALYFNIRDTSAPGFGRLMASAKTMVVTEGIPPGRLDSLRQLMVNLTGDAAREGYATNADAQARFTNANIYSADYINAEARGLLGQPRPAGDAIGVLALAAAAASRSDYGPLRVASGDFSDVRSVTSANFDRTPYAAMGLNWDTFKDLRAQGFGDIQIRAAARTTTALGIDVNRNAPAVARITRDIPSAIPGLHTTRDKWRAIGDLERRKREAEARGDTSGAAALAQQIEAQRREAEAHDRREREKVERERPDRAEDHRKAQQAIREAQLALTRSRLENRTEPVDAANIDAEERARIRSTNGQHENLRSVADQTIVRGQLARTAAIKSEADDLLGPTPAPASRPAVTPTATAAASPTPTATQVASTPRPVAAGPKPT